MKRYVHTKIINKHATASDWKDSDYIPLIAELIVYDVDSENQYPRFKIGDGVRLVNDLPFVVDTAVDSLMLVHNQSADAHSDIRDNIDTLANSVAQKSQVQIVTWGDDD